MEDDVEYYKALAEKAMFAYQELYDALIKEGYAIKRTDAWKLFIEDHNSK